MLENKTFFRDFSPLCALMRTLVMEIYANASVFVQQLSQNKHTDLLLEQQLCHTLYVGIALDLDNPGQKTTFKVLK